MRAVGPLDHRLAAYLAQFRQAWDVVQSRVAGPVCAWPPTSLGRALIAPPPATSMAALARARAHR